MQNYANFQTFSLFKGKNFTPESTSLGYLPTQTVSLFDEDLEKYLKLKEILEDNADVSTVWVIWHKSWLSTRWFDGS